MKAERVQFLPDPDLEAFSRRLDEKIHEILGALGPAEFGRNIVGQLMRSHLGSAFHAVGANEGTFWLADRDTEELVPIFNNGPQAEKMLSEIRQPVGEGMIGMVFSTEQSFCENEVYKNQRHDKRIDRNLSNVTCAMIAAPIFFAKAARGVVSCVRLKSTDSGEPDPPAFTHRDFRHIQVAADMTEILIENRLRELVLKGS